jgi:uncharacterized protein YegL
MKTRAKSRQESPVPAENPEQRILAVLALDRSLSMTEPCRLDLEDPNSPLTTPLDELKSAMPRFQAECAADSLLRLQLEVASVTFCGEVSRTPFRAIADWTPPALEAGGGTALGQALLTAVDLVAQRQQELKELGVPVRHVFVLAITDGADNSDRPELPGQAARRIQELEAAGGFSFLPVGVQDADLERLAIYTRKREPLRLKGLRFAQLFNWLRRSIVSASRSRPGDGIRLPSPLHNDSNPDGWAELRG